MSLNPSSAGYKLCALGKSVKLSAPLLFIYKVGIIIIFMNKVGVRIKLANACEVLSAWHTVSVQ
jgi:hypothetical protein